MDELVSEFLTETNENLTVIDTELVTLEKNPNNPSILGNIFRLVHTIKGTCGFLGLSRLEKVAHSAENVLGKFRDGAMEVSSDSVSLVLEALDRIKGIMAELEATGSEPAGDDRELINRLDTMAREGAKAGKAAAPAPAAPEPVAPPPTSEEIAAAMAEETGDGAGAGARFDHDLGRELKDGEVSLAELDKIFAETPAETAAPSPTQSTAPVKVEAPKPETKPAAKAADVDKPPAGGEAGAATQSIRVNVDLLENMMNLVSELVLTRNQLLQMVRHKSDSEFAVPLQGLSHVTTELQESVMKTRMQPIGNAWQKLPRIVRDLASELGKKIELVMEGAETELDRQVLELIKDPLTHMVRNSGDHGLETPAERVASGKPETGRIVLNAHHEGGHIIIQISDDGRGINIERVRQKARDQGLLRPEQAEALTEREAVNLVFRPGFSTAEKVTSISGRGVGMDVVKTNIDKIGGTVDIKSTTGKGSTFTIKIPLTLAIISALVVECEEQRYAIPQLSVVELVRASEKSEYRIETISATPVLRLRDRLLPLVYLRDILGIDNAGPGAERTPRLRNSGEAFIVVTQVGNYRFGIVVDRVFDSEEIVVKPVAPILKDLKEFSGNTILGDGSVIMILDPNGIAAATGEISVPETQDHDATAERAKAFGDDAVELLLFRAGDGEPKAVPLSLVSRLEEFEVDKIEASNNRTVVQYRGKLMPLVPTNDAFRRRDKGRQPVIVFAEGDRSMGLLVDEIVDIVEDHLEVELSSDQPGLIGSAIVSGKATGVIDTGFYLTRAFGDWFKRTAAGQAGRGKRVLLVDDSPFFLNLIAPVLTTAGYKVTTANNAEEAVARCDAGDDYDVIVSDIEMPGMNGFEFATAVRQGSRWKDTPMVALSSRTAPEDIDRGLKAGFNRYVAKHDRDDLVAALAETANPIART